MGQVGKRLALLMLVIATVGCDRVTKQFAAATLAEGPTKNATVCQPDQNFTAFGNEFDTNRLCVGKMCSVESVDNGTCFGIENRDFL